MEIKKNSKIVEGDCFAYKIENDEEYKGRYLILIATELNTSNNGTGSPNEKYFRYKLTKDTNIPTTKEEIEELDYVLNQVMSMGMRFFPFHGDKPIEDEIKEKEKVKVYPDENGYLYIYTFGMKISAKNKKEKLIYLGNYDIKKPEHEFIPFSLINMRGYAFKYFEEDSLYSYRSYNLKQCDIWNNPKEFNCNGNLLLDIVSTWSKHDNLDDAKEELLKKYGNSKETDK